MTDAQMLDWIEAHDADVSCLRAGPEGECHRPWSVFTGVSQDGRGQTLREAILDAVSKMRNAVVAGGGADAHC